MKKQVVYDTLGHQFVQEKEHVGNLTRVRNYPVMRLMVMKKDIIIATVLTMLLFICIVVIMLDIHKTFNVMSNIYKQEHKVFVPDTMPQKLSPDTLTNIKPIRTNEYFRN